MTLIITLLSEVCVSLFIISIVLYVLNAITKNVLTMLLIIIPIITILIISIVYLNYKTTDKKEIISSSTSLTRLTAKELAKHTNVYLQYDEEFYIYEVVKTSGGSYNKSYVITKIDVNEASFNQLEKILMR